MRHDERVNERIAYDEFSLFQENAAEYGIPFEGPPQVRRELVEVSPGFSLSALVWGSAPPEIVFLHGGAQNAHTWDTVALALDRPLLAIDLPGHGHSDASPEALSPQSNAAAVAEVIRALAPTARVVVGMSLGGLTAIALAAHAPELVRRLVLVDITPGVTGQKSQAITAFVNGPKTFPSYEELLARTIEHNPTRTEASLRRGILHNALQTEDGSWVWRYRRFDQPSPLGEVAAPADPQAIENRFSPLWDMLAAVTVPVLLVRGMLKQSVVDDADEDEFRRVVALGTVERIENAGHSVQGDTPLELAALIARLAGPRFLMTVNAPRELVTEHFRLEPLGPQHNERDYAAWMSSLDHIRSTPGFVPDQWNGDAWPYEMPLTKNLADLVNHAAEFETGEAFAFTVLDPTTDDVIGCVYVDPDTTGFRANAMCRSWVRASHAHLDVELYDALRHWLGGDAWPFTSIYFPGR